MEKKKMIIAGIAICAIVALLAAVFFIFISNSDTDIFYYSKNDRRLKSAMKEHQAQIQADVFQYLKNNYKTEYGLPDTKKISYNMNNIYAMYEWDYESLLGFMKAKNKADYLKGLEILEVWVPVYYNGKPLDTHYATFEYSKESNSFEYTENKYSNNSLGNKSYVEKVLMANYEVFHTAKIGELCFVLIQKDGEDFVKYVDEAYFFDISEIDLNAKNSDPIYKEFHDWFFKREFTVAEIEYICKTIQNGNS